MADSRLDVARLVLDFHQPLYRYAFRLTGSVPDAEDLTQQAFLIAQQKLEQVREADCVQSWLFTVLRHCYTKSFRRHIPMLASTLGLDIDSIPQETAELDIDQERLQGALDELPDEFRLPVVMFYFEELSYKEIAEQLDLPLGTVMSRLSRGKSHLRRRLFVADSPEHETVAGKARPGGDF